MACIFLLFAVQEKHQSICDPSKKKARKVTRILSTSHSRVQQQICEIRPHPAIALTLAICLADIYTRVTPRQIYPSLGGIGACGIHRHINLAVIHLLQCKHIASINRDKFKLLGDTRGV